MESKKLSPTKLYVPSPVDSKFRVSIWRHTAQRFLPIESEPIEEKFGYVLTEDELLDLKKKWADEAWDNGAIDAQGNYSDAPDKETYLNNLTIE